MNDEQNWSSPGGTPERPVKDVVERLLALIDAFEREGEVRVVVDVLAFKGLLTLHIPLPFSEDTINQS